MYTFGAIAPRSMQMVSKVATPKLAAPRIGMVAQARTITPAKTVALKLAVAPLAPATLAPAALVPAALAPVTPAPAPASPEAPKPQQVQVVLVPPQEKAATPETKWYRSPQFIGGVVSAVALGALGLAFEHFKKPKV